MKDKEDEARIKAYMAAKMNHIKMYNECMNLADGLDVEKFAELVRADEREKVAQWMMERGFATGHGDSIEDLLKELEWQVAERERNACSKVVEDTLEPWLINEYIVRTTEAIQARGNDLQTAIEKGTKAWADVPDATEWVEELRGHEPVAWADKVGAVIPHSHKLFQPALLKDYTRPLYTAPQREWVGLTDEEKANWKALGLVGVEIVAAHLKEKNT